MVTGDCKYDESKGKVEVKSYVAVPKRSAALLIAAIEKQPVSVTIDANETVFSNYKSGVLDSTDCGIELDHAVAAVGYGTTPSPTTLA